MHILDGVLSPAVCGGAAVLSAAAVGVSLTKLRGTLAERTVPLTGMMAALVFAGQMVNFPLSLFGIPASGHLLGGVLASVVLGPWAGCVAIFVVLLLQCFLFGDGGIFSLGVNTMNMAVLGAWGGYPIYITIRKRISGARGAMVGAVVASWLTVLAAATAFCLEFWLSHGGAAIDFSRLFTLMVIVHSAIGVGEAVITGGIVSFVIAQRPELIPAGDIEQSTAVRWTRWAGVGCIAALAVAAFLAPFASSLDDGLETVSTEVQVPVDEDAGPKLSVWDDYEVPVPVASWAGTAVWEKVSVGAAGVLGTLAVCLTAYLLTRATVGATANVEDSREGIGSI